MALGVAGGYLLGRTRKMKLALMLGGLAAGRRAGGTGGLLGQAAKLLGESPEVARLGDELRGRLVESGKAAVASVAARQVDALAERLGSRVGSLTDLVAPAGESGDRQPDGAESEQGPPAREETSDAGAEPSEAGQGNGEAAAEKPPRRAPARARASGSVSGAATPRKRRTRATAKTAGGTATGRPARAERSAEND